MTTHNAQRETHNAQRTTKNATIIGAGNMGGAMAKAICKADKGISVRVSNPSPEKLVKLRQEFPEISTFSDNVEAIKGAEVIILAVKPWILPDVVEEIAPYIDPETQIVVSVAGGVDFWSLSKMFGDYNEDLDMDALQLYRAIPNTAISVGKGMTFVCSQTKYASGLENVSNIFSLMGEVAVIDENHIDAGTALCSCGIAYVFKAVQAAVQAGVQLGFRPADALRYVNATVDGAIALLQQDGAIPQTEIDKVTTPGGMTIRGINQLEHDAFPSAIINAILAPLKK